MDSRCGSMLTFYDRFWKGVVSIAEIGREVLRKLVHESTVIFATRVLDSYFIRNTGGLQTVLAVF